MVKCSSKTESTKCKGCGNQFPGISNSHYCPVCIKEKDSNSILLEAEEIIHGPRRDAYGPAKESFERLAQVLSVVLHRKLKEPLTSHDAAMVGVALKLCRESVKPNRDNRVDGAGYFALADEVTQ